MGWPREFQDHELLDHVDEIVYVVGVETDDPHRSPVRYVNSRVEQILGYPPTEFLADRNLWISLVHPEDLERLAADTARILESRTSGVREYRLRSRREEAYRWFEDRLTPRLDGEGRLTDLVGVARDVTDRRRMERQLLQSQKMEAVGRLAGGIAHDFNNILTVISGYGDLLLGSTAGDRQIRHCAENIVDASRRAAALTRQLLAFSRTQVLELRVLDLNQVVRNLVAMLDRIIGANVKLSLELAPAPGRVRADQSQIEQVIVNLIVNGRDAVAGRGQLTIRTADAALDEDYARAHPGAKPGRYVMLCVGDTGAGMDAATRAHIFEPFFTTKQPGVGTGLGLATVYGIVKQCSGYIWVDSEPGAGSTFRVYLPRVDQLAEPVPSRRDAGAPARGSETILVVERESSLRELTAIVLRSHGYSVLESKNADEALHIAEEAGRRIDLLIGDVLMPGVSGEELAERFRLVCPQSRVLLVSGYPAEVLLRSSLGAGTPLLQKPFTPAALAQKVREVLDEPPAPGTGGGAEDTASETTGLGPARG
jgi:PAS domain S-box-containing protein